jgi:hypothetical protein
MATTKTLQRQQRRKQSSYDNRNQRRSDDNYGGFSVLDGQRFNGGLPPYSNGSGGQILRRRRIWQRL